jgi:hypothetical protein
MAYYAELQPRQKFRQWNRGSAYIQHTNRGGVRAFISFSREFFVTSQERLPDQINQQQADFLRLKVGSHHTTADWDTANRGTSRLRT